MLFKFVLTVQLLDLIHVGLGIKLELGRNLLDRLGVRIVDGAEKHGGLLTDKALDGKTGDDIVEGNGFCRRATVTCACLDGRAGQWQ